MSIAHELSCDVAAAMLSERKDETGASVGDDLASIVLEVHTTLRRLTSEARRSRLNSQLFPAPQATPPDTSSAASGSH